MYGGWNTFLLMTSAAGNATDHVSMDKFSGELIHADVIRGLAGAALAPTVAAARVAATSVDLRVAAAAPRTTNPSSSFHWTGHNI